jgi:TonB family protein
MKQLIILFLLLGCATAFAQPARQDTTIVYSRTGMEKDPVRANLKKVIEKKDSLWVVSLYEKKNVLREQVFFADEKAEIRKGPYFWYENGILTVQGQYDRGYKAGAWKTYYPNGKLRDSVFYHWDKLYGAYVKYWDNGQLKESGKYNDGQPIGHRNLFYRDGMLAAKEFYDEKEKISGAYYDAQGAVVGSESIIQPPSFPGGMSAFAHYLAKALKYPAAAAKKNTEGTVQLQFTVRADGSIANIKVVESPDEQLSKEAIRVLREGPIWIAGREMGEPVDMKFKFPIKFILKK